MNLELNLRSQHQDRKQYMSNIVLYSNLTHIMPSILNSLSLLLFYGGLFSISRRVFIWLHMIMSFIVSYHDNSTTDDPGSSSRAWSRGGGCGHLMNAAFREKVRNQTRAADVHSSYQKFGVAAQGAEKPRPQLRPTHAVGCDCTHVAGP